MPQEEYHHLIGIIVITGVQPPLFTDIGEAIKAHSIPAGRNYQYEYDLTKKEHSIRFSCYGTNSECDFLAGMTKFLATDGIDNKDIKTCQFLLSEMPYKEFEPQ